MRIDQLRQFQYCPKRNRGMIPLWKLIAINWIEHPSRNGDLVPFGKLDYKTFLLEAAQGAHHFYFRSIKGMMSVMNLLGRKFVSSMMIRCVILSRLICWRMVTISERFKSCWGTMT